MRNKLLTLTLLALLVGCGTVPKKVETTITIPPTYSQDIPIPKTQPTDLKPINFVLLNRAAMLKYLNDHQGQDFVLYTLDDANSAILIGNVQEMRRYMQDQQALIKYLIGVIDARKQKGDK